MVSNFFDAQMHARCFCHSFVADPPMRAYRGLRERYRSAPTSLLCSFIRKNKLLSDFIHSAEPFVRLCSLCTSSVVYSLSKHKTPIFRQVFYVWRRERDSNPRRDSRPSNDLANRPLQPLGYLSSSCPELLPRFGYYQRLWLKTMALLLKFY